MPEEIPEKLFSTEESERLRQQFIREKIVPALERRFERYPQLRSAALLVGQYYCDEAHDAVHDFWVFSVLESPDLTVPFLKGQAKTDPANLPGPESIATIRWDKSLPVLPWEENWQAIPLFAAFCKESDVLGGPIMEAYSPFAIFRNTPDGVEIDFCGEMFRPWLDGLCPIAMGVNRSPDEIQKLKASWLESFEG